MSNIHSKGFEDTERLNETVLASAQTADNIGVCILALQPNDEQFQGTLTITGGDDDFDGVFEIYGQTNTVPFKSKATPEDMTFTFELGQNNRLMTGVMFVDDEG